MPCHAIVLHMIGHNIRTPASQRVHCVRKRNERQRKKENKTDKRDKKKANTPKERVRTGREDQRCEETQIT